MSDPNSTDEGAAPEATPVFPSTMDPKLRSLIEDAAWYIREAAAFEPEVAIGHHLADELFDALGIDRSGPEHEHVREPMEF